MDGVVATLSAKCDSSQRNDLVSLVEFGRDCDTTPSKVKQQVADMQKQVAEKESAAANLGNRVKESEKQLAELNAKLKEATDKLATLEQDNTALKAQVTDMQDKATKKEDYIKDLVARISELKGGSDSGKGASKK